MSTRIRTPRALVLFLFSNLCEGFLPGQWSAHSSTSCRDARRTALLALPTFHLDNIARIFCLSDLHTDHVDNMKWLKRTVSKSDLTQNDLLIVAGDISHDMAVFAESLQVLRDRCQVFFVNGNHEAWVNRKSHDYDSIGKLAEIYKTCRKYSVFIDPIYLSGPYPLWIVGLQAWYDGSLSFSEGLCKDFNTWPWADFVRCDWPALFPAMPDDDINAGIPQGLVDYFLELNRINLAKFPIYEHAPCPILSVSHFLPNRQCLPDWVGLDSTSFDMDWLNHGAGGMSAKFAKVAGTHLLDRQIRSLQPPKQKVRQIHVFGHSHRPKDFEFEGIRYVHNPLGKPSERQMYMVSPLVNLQLLWELDRGEVAGETIIRFWELKGGGTKALRERLERVRPGRYRQR